MTNAAQIIEKQVLRGHVLKIAEAAEPLGAGTEIIQATLRNHGINVNKIEVLNACRYLEGKSLVRVERVENAVLGISRDIAHITPEGVDVLEGTETVSGVELGA